MKILFVCTGNTCRSPMAEALYRKIMKKHGRFDEVCSRGTSVGFSSELPIGSEEMSSKVMLKEYGIDISGHQPKPVTIDDIISADLILAMKQEHVYQLKDEFNEFLGCSIDGKLYVYGDYIGYKGQEVEDPMAEYTEESYMYCVNQLSIWAQLLAIKLN